MQAVESVLNWGFSNPFCQAAAPMRPSDIMEVHIGNRAANRPSHTATAPTVSLDFVLVARRTKTRRVPDLRITVARRGPHVSVSGYRVQLLCF